MTVSRCVHCAQGGKKGKDYLHMGYDPVSNNCESLCSLYKTKEKAKTIYT